VEAVIGAIETDGLETGRHTIFVRGKDDDDNWGAFSAVFLYVAEQRWLPLLMNR
jgi:hypothetical protein